MKKKATKKKATKKKATKKKATKKKATKRKATKKKATKKKATKRLGKIIERGDGGYELLVFDFPASEFLEERGWQGGGHSWGAIAEALLGMRSNADTRGAIRFDCEGDTFVAISASEAHLVDLSELLGEASEDRHLLEQAIAEAEANGSME